MKLNVCQFEGRSAFSYAETYSSGRRPAGRPSTVVFVSSVTLTAMALCWARWARRLHSQTIWRQQSSPLFRIGSIYTSASAFVISSLDPASLPVVRWASTLKAPPQPPGRPPPRM